MQNAPLKHILLAIAVSFLLTQATSFAADTHSNLESTFIVDCKRDLDYGLHSYYLFLQPPVYQAQSNAWKQMELLLRKISKAKHFNSKTPIAMQQNIYIPVSFEPQSWIKQPQEDDFNAAARWAMQNYDYQCARTLLKSFPRLIDNGPYIISSATKIQPQKLLLNNPNPTATASYPVLAQNLSNIDSINYSYWLDIFFKKSWHPRQWAETHVFRLHDTMLESVFLYEMQLNEQSVTQVSTPQATLVAKDLSQSNEENKNNTLDASIQNPNPEDTRLISDEDVPPSFIALENPAESAIQTSPLHDTILQIDPSQNYPVNELSKAPTNPYSDVITIEFSASLP